MSALREYITIDDVKNKLFKIASTTEKQDYINIANMECEDVAILNGVQPEDITLETHHKLKQYLINYATARFAEDRVGSNAPNGTFQGDDVYLDLFKRSMYRMQNLKPELVSVIFTGDSETPDNRAIISQRIYFG